MTDIDCIQRVYNSTKNSKLRKLLEQATHGVRCEGYDILYTINSVNFRDGSKYRRNSDEYAEEEQRAAKTVVANIKNEPISVDEFFDFRSLEYYCE